VAHMGTLPPLVKAKLSPPQVGEACLRPTTLDLFQESLKRRLTIVCAPAGYGKTTAALATLNRVGVRSIWYKLDVLDQDPVSLIASLVEALDRLYRGFGQRIRDRLDNAHDVPYPIEQMTAEFVAEATEKVDSDIHILLDDYHEAADSHSLNTTLNYLVANLPDTMRFVILSRYEPAFEVGRLRLANQVGVIGVDHLRFGPDEVAEVVAGRTGIALSPEHASALADLTEGWPASIVLAAQALRWTGVEPLAHALSDPRLKQDVFSYLAEQVYSRESAEVKAFLRRTCCLEYVSPDLARRVGAPRRANRILAHLVANGVFTFATVHDGTFRYHSLFREFLRQKSIQEDGSDRFHRLQLLTAQALEAHGDIERAVELCLAANEPRLALEVVGRAGEMNLDAFRSDTLASWLVRLPDALRRDEPWAHLIAGEVDMRAGHFDPALDHIARAVEQLEATEDRRGLYHALSAQERTLFWKGRTSEAAVSCRRALETADEDEQRVHALISLGAALEAECLWADTALAFDRATRLACGLYPAELARLAAHTAYVRSNTGRYLSADSAIETAMDCVTQHGSPSLRVAFLNFAAMNQLFTAMWDRSRQSLEAARKLGSRYGYQFLDALMDDVDAQLSASVGDFERAAHTCRRAIDAPSIADDPYCRSLALCHAGTSARRCGDVDSATAWYGRAMDAARGAAAPYAYLNAAANLAFTDRSLGDAARERLAEVADEAQDLDLLFVALKAEFFAATLRYRASDRSSALGSLALCVPRQLELGHLNFLAQELVLEPAMTADFLHETTDAGTVASILDLIARHWNGMQILIACQTLDSVAGAAAARAAAAHRDETDVTSVLAKATRSPYPELRRLATELRRARREGASGDEAQHLALTNRERQIIELIADGLTNDELARQLYISPATVKTHVNHIFTKLGARDRVAAVIQYRRLCEGQL